MPARSAPDLPPPLLPVARHQLGVVTLAQCQAVGMTARAVEWRVASGRWKRLHRGVFLTSGGPPLLPARAMAAVIVGGRGSAVSHLTSAALSGLAVDPGAKVHLAVDHTRHPEARAGLVLHRIRGLDDWVDPTAWPPRVTVERTVLDLAQTGSLDAAIALVSSACQRHLTSPRALLRALSRRRGQRWGRELREVLADVAAGAHSVLEVRYVRDVERPHGLPVAERQLATDLGRRRYHDNGYRAQRVLVELDGRLGHDGWSARKLDATRDREVGADGWFTVRAGWSDVVATPCVLARQVADVLRARGWTGAPRRCRRGDCVVR